MGPYNFECRHLIRVWVTLCGLVSSIFFFFFCTAVSARYSGVPDNVDSFFTDEAPTYYNLIDPVTQINNFGNNVQTQATFTKGTQVYQYSFIEQRLIVSPQNLTWLFYNHMIPSIVCGGPPVVHLDSCAYLELSIYCFIETKYIKLANYPVGQNSYSNALGGWAQYVKSIDGVFEYDQFIYWFLGDLVYRYDAYSDSPVDGPFLISTVFPGAPSNISDVSNHPYAGLTLFFKGSQYWVWDKMSRQMLSGYPINIDGNKTVCNGHDDLSSNLGFVSDKDYLLSAQSTNLYDVNMQCDWRVWTHTRSIYGVYPFVTRHEGKSHDIQFHGFFGGDTYDQSGQYLYPLQDFWLGMVFTFTYFDLGSGNDSVSIYENNDAVDVNQAASPVLIATFTRSNPPTLLSPITTSRLSRSISIRFNSDNDNTIPGSGFFIGWSNIIPETQNFTQLGLESNWYDHTLFQSFTMNAVYSKTDKIVYIAPATQTPSVIVITFRLEVLPESRMPDVQILVYNGLNTSLASSLAYNCTNITNGGEFGLAHTMNFPTCTVSAFGSATVVLKGDPTLNIFISGNYNVQTSCQGSQNITSVQGTINDGSTGRSYFPNQECWWFVTPPPVVGGLFIAVTFDNLDIAGVGDTISLYPMHSGILASQPSTVISGSNIPVPIAVQSTMMAIRFVSGGAPVGDGFSLSYTVVYQPDTTQSLVSPLQSALQVAPPPSSLVNVVHDNFTIVAGHSQALQLTVTARDQYSRPYDNSFYSSTPPLFSFFARIIPRSLNAKHSGVLSALSTYPNSLRTATNSMFGLSPAEFNLTTEFINVGTVITLSAPLIAGQYLLAVSMSYGPNPTASIELPMGEMNFTVIPSTASSDNTMIRINESSSMAGHPRYFIVDSYDAYQNHLLTDDGTSVRVFMQIPAVAAVIPTESSFNNGTALFTLTPTVAGLYDITVQVGAQDIPGAPFSVWVVPGPTDSMHSEVHGLPAQVDYSVSSSPILISVILYDSFNNLRPFSSLDDVGMSCDVDSSAIVHLPSYNNTYFFNFLIPRAPQATITATVNGNLIANFPFVVNINVYVPWTISSGLFVVVIVLVAIGYVCCFVAFVMIIKNKSHPVIKASSPLFCCVTISGIAVGLSIPLINLTTFSVSTCIVVPMLAGISFSLTFGALFVKTYRLYKIFLNPKLELRVLTNSQLFVPVLGLAIINVIIVFAIMTSHPPVIQKEADWSKTYIIDVCDTNNSAVFLVPYFVEWVALLGIGTFLVYNVRNIPETYNETKWIGLCIYNITFSALILIPVVLSIESLPLIYLILSTLGIIYVAISSLVILFVPKIQLVLQSTSTKRTLMTVHNSSTPSNESDSTNRISIAATTYLVALAEIRKYFQIPAKNCNDDDERVSTIDSPKLITVRTFLPPRNVTQ